MKKNKDKFDKLKLDCLQKIDLLAASRCNLFSSVRMSHELQQLNLTIILAIFLKLLANYQNCLLRFWGKAASAHSTVAETFKGYQHFEFVVVKVFSHEKLNITLALNTSILGFAGTIEETG